MNRLVGNVLTVSLARWLSSHRFQGYYRLGQIGTDFIRDSGDLVVLDVEMFE